MPLDVLIVEDEPVVAESAARILRGAKLDVELATDSQSAIAALDRGAVRVVLCDLMLPGESGLRVLAAARFLRPLAQVIVITGYATCENALASFKSGAFDFLPKPFDVDELLAVVTRALRCFDRASAAGSSASGPRRRVDGASADPVVDRNGRYLLGRHAWATKDDDGSATLGVGAAFPGLVGSTRSIEIAQPDDHLLQCRQCALVRGEDHLDHRVWAPLSGRVIAVNRALESNPQSLDREPWEECWLVRIVPESPVEELSNLVHD